MVQHPVFNHGAPQSARLECLLGAAKSNRMHRSKFHHIKYAIFRLSKPKDSASVAGKEHFRLLLGKSETA